MPGIDHIVYKTICVFLETRNHHTHTHTNTMSYILEP